MDFTITISNENIMLWQEENFGGDVILDVTKEELDTILPILMRKNCDCLIRRYAGKE